MSNLSTKKIEKIKETNDLDSHDIRDQIHGHEERRNNHQHRLTVCSVFERVVRYLVHTIKFFAKVVTFSHNANMHTGQQNIKKSATSIVTDFSINWSINSKISEKFICLPIYTFYIINSEFIGLNYNPIFQKLYNEIQ